MINRDPSRSIKEQFRHEVELILDNLLTPEAQAHPLVANVREMLALYWDSRAATNDAVLKIEAQKRSDSRQRGDEKRNNPSYQRRLARRQAERLGD